MQYGQGPCNAGEELDGAPGILAPAPGGLDGQSAGERLRAHWRGELERWSCVSAHLPLAGKGPFGAGLALGRRAVRRVLRWYINPIVEQQNRFNAAAVSLDALDRPQRCELARELHDLRERVAALEDRLATGEGRTGERG